MGHISSLDKIFNVLMFLASHDHQGFIKKYSNIVKYCYNFQTFPFEYTSKRNFL